MIALDLISDSIPSVKTTDEAARALDWMAEFKLSQLPIVEGTTYRGIITEEDIMDAADLKIEVGEIRYSGRDGAYANAEAHIYDVIKVMAGLNLQILPVVEEDHKYAGVITLTDLLRSFERIYALEEPGGILVVEIPERGYVLSEVGRITESADAKILSLYLSKPVSGNHLLLTLKLNVEDLSRLVSTFERFGYTVLRTYQQSKLDEDYQRNLDALIRYLDI